MKSKFCFTCGKRLPLIMYHTDDSKYQIKSNKGKCIECRLCFLKRALNQKGYMQRVDGKFKFIQVNTSCIIKKFFVR